MILAHWPTVVAAFLASFVEFVEALTIVLAVGVVRGWRAALLGALAAAIALAVLIVVLGPHIAGLNIPIFQLIVGTLLLLFGLRWLRKGILRAAGVLALHDESKAFARETAALRQGAAAQGFDYGAAAASFNGVFIEGVEVVFIVLAVGAATGASGLAYAGLGAAAAGVIVILLGLAARHPLSSIPENSLKLVVGILLSAFGTFWTGEGLRLAWPGGDWSILLLALTYLVITGLGILLARSVTTLALIDSTETEKAIL